MLRAARRTASSTRWCMRRQSTTVDPTKQPRVEPLLVKKRGLSLVQDPVYNKGTAFPLAERDRLGLRGLVPPRTLTMELQLEKNLVNVRAEPDPLRQHMFLTTLQNRNETLFYRLLIDHIKEFAPVVYTPTVGLVCQKFGYQFRRPRGMYFSAQDRGHMHAMVYNWPIDDVQVMVVTDGSRILGLGDLGAHGMGIPIGKLSLYCAAGGIYPHRTLPVMLDFGTDNEELLRDPYYLGMQHRRLQGDDYFTLLDEFMQAVRRRWPRALVQFEDFSSDKAAAILHKYRLRHLCFNDDVQGTGSVTLAGVFSALRAQGSDAQALRQQRVVVAGAGSAGMGVATTLLQGMVQQGLSTEEAQRNFWMLDRNGLITGSRAQELTQGQLFFARRDAEQPWDLLRVVREVKPTILLGLTAQAGAFSEEVVREMAKHNERPIIFPLSNPTSVAECTAEEVYRWTEGRGIFASGSPFDPVHFGGRTLYPSQCNNMFIFPGVGLGATVANARRVSDKMFYAAAEALGNTLNDSERSRGMVFPDIDRIRYVSLQVAAAVASSAVKEGLAQDDGCCATSDLEGYVARRMFEPRYAPVVHVA